MKKSPFFTVVIPTYNRGSVLAEAVESVLKQRCDDFELIIVDDHSTDDTRRVLMRWNDPRIRILENKRTKGAAGARNTAIFAARGEWIAFLDSDDVWLPEKLAAVIIRAKDAADNIGLFYTGNQHLDEAGRVTHTGIPTQEGWLQKELLYSNFIGGFSNVVVRKALLLALGGLDERFPASEDLDLFVRIAGRAKLKSISQPLTLYRADNSDKLGLQFRKRLKAYVLFAEKHRDLLSHSLTLRHRAASRVFEMAVLSADFSQAVRAFPMTSIGIAVDPGNVIRMSRNIFSEISRMLRSATIVHEPIRKEQRQLSLETMKVD